MLDKLIVCELEADGVASVDIVRLGRSIRRAHIATHILGVDHIVRERGHIAVRVLADVRVVRTDGLSVNNELREDVMGVGGKRSCQQRRFEGPRRTHPPPPRKRRRPLHRHRQRASRRLRLRLKDLHELRL